MYEIKIKQLLKKGKPLKQLSEGSPIYRFYSAESGYILPNHEAEILSGNIVELPYQYKGIIKSCIKKDKAESLYTIPYHIADTLPHPLCIKVKNISDSPIEIAIGEPIGTLTIKEKYR